MFVPSNVPLALLPFLVIIELISHVAKIFSLAIRLFANMMSGHVLLHILTSFVLKLAKLNLVFIIFPLILITAIILLEYGISMLQAYVFATLLAIYFEEHFGFSQKDKNSVSNLVRIYGQVRSVIKRNFFLRKHVKCYAKMGYGWRTDRKKKGRTKKDRTWVFSTYKFLIF